MLIVAIQDSSSNNKRYIRRTQKNTTGKLPTVPHPIEFPAIIDELYRERTLQSLQRIRRLNRYRQLHTHTRRDMVGLERNRLIERWRRSVVAFLRQAEWDLSVAKQHMNLTNYRGAMQAAAAGVENVSEALIICYGGKPDSSPGQEEPLRMVAHRFKEEEEKREFLESIDTIARINRNRKTLRRISTAAVHPHISKRAQKTLQSASEIVTLFKRIITDNFTSEIPQLHEKCPKCHSLNITTHISLPSFDDRKVNQECNICHHKWTEPRIILRRPATRNTPNRIQLRRRVPLRRPSQHRINTKTLITTWRNAITNLIFHAIENLNLAKLHMRDANYIDTVREASISVENIARAMIHCFGAKADIEPGQEEVLRMIAPKVIESRREQFLKTINIVAEIARTRKTIRQTSARNIQTRLVNKTIANNILESSRKIVDLYREIIHEQFSTELPSPVFNYSLTFRTKRIS